MGEKLENLIESYKELYSMYANKNDDASNGKCLILDLVISDIEGIITEGKNVQN